MICPSCGFDNVENAKFCSECGASLLTVQPVRREERKTVTVVFADLVGSTARAERLDPEDVRAILAPYHDRLRQELERHGGTVEKFIGDAVVGVFGAPLAHEDDPERAVRAALAIQEAIAELNEADPRLQLKVRVGVNTGEALVSVGARPELGESMVAGDVMNSGARLQAATPVGGILVSETTYRATDRAIEYREVAPVTAKGKEQPLPAWVAVARRSAFGVDVGGGGKAPLVGRERELDVLTDALARARAELEPQPQLVTLVGVPGIGKSRLVYELYRLVDAEPELITWRQGRSLSYGEGVAFWALGEMVKAQAGILESDDEDEASEKLSRAVADLLPDAGEAEWVERHLRSLVGLATETTAGHEQGSDAPAAWRRFVEALAESRPTVLVFEDLHWADDGLLDFLDDLVDWVRDVPLLVVGTARPELLERRSGWGGGKRNSITISLGPLSDVDTARLVGALLERSVLSAETQTELLARAGGNPLYAEEFARMRSLAGDGEVPETLQAIVAARIDALPLEEKSVLQLGAVLGKVFWTGALTALGGGESDLDGRLRSLERKEFVRRERRSAMEGEQQYVFLHALIRDVAYGQLPRAERAQKHRLAAEWIESLGRIDDHADLIAHHYLAALELARAAGRATVALEEPARIALRGAGDRAVRLGAISVAARLYASALELWPVDDPDRARLLLAGGRARSLADDAGRAALEEARDLLLAQGEIEGAAEAQSQISTETWRRGDTAIANEELALAVTMLEDRPPSIAKAEVLTTLCGRHMIAEEFEDSIRVGELAIRVAHDVGADGARAGALLSVGASRAGLGKWEAGMEKMEQGVDLARETRSWQLVRGLGLVRDVSFELGDLGRSGQFLAEGLAEAERAGMANALRWLRGEWAVELFHAGDWDGACALLEDVVSKPDAPFWYDPEALRVRALVRLARGEHGAAHEDAARALEQARPARDPQSLYPALTIAALVASTRGDRAAATARVDELLGLLRAARIRITRASWVVDLARVLLQLGRGDELAEPLESVPRRTQWAEASVALASGRAEEAVVLFASIPSRPYEAVARKLAGEALVAAGRRSEADIHLYAAAAFWQSVGATFYLRETETLLAAAS